MNFGTGQKLQINYMGRVFKSFNLFNFTIICIHCWARFQYWVPV